MLAIPVRMDAPIDASTTIRFNQLHGKCRSRLLQQLDFPVSEQVVPRHGVVKGHEFSKGQYVLFSTEELEGLLVKATHAIEISGKLLHLLNRKVAGQDISTVPEAAPKAHIIDLLEALKASLATTGPGDSAPTEDRRPPKRSLRQEPARKDKKATV